MPQSEIASMAHLMRRAGFGATRDELEAYVAKGYETTVEELLYPEKAPPALEDEDLVGRYHAGQYSLHYPLSAQAYWMHRMIHTRRPLEEKMSLFWHGVFATAFTKVYHPKQVLRQIDMFRRYGFGSFRTLLLEVSKDPAMIFWLDNKDNHMGGYNENFGRELLELFSMGVGNYTEQDVYEASRAFTGWTMRNADLHSARTAEQVPEPYGRLDWQFEYRDEDHDDTEKTFLGHTGKLNGDDIIDIICRQPATARFIARHLYNYFVADEPQVPAWQTVPPLDPEAIEILTNAFVANQYDIRSVLRVMFNSAFFKNAVAGRVKSPAELVAGTMRLVGTNPLPETSDINLSVAVADMGQGLLDPPSVEGWHTGTEWLTTGSLVARINFASHQFADADKPGVRAIIDRVRALPQPLSPDRLVDACLDFIGPITVSQSTRQEMVEYAESGGEIRFGTEHEDRVAAQRVTAILQLIVATREYQLA